MGGANETDTDERSKRCAVFFCEFVKRITELYPEIYGSGTSEGRIASDYFEKWGWYATIDELAKGRLWKYKYKNSEVHLVCFTSVQESKGYGFDLSGWQNGTTWSKNNLRLATEAEIEEALINEAKKRGFKEGVVFNSPNGKNHFNKEQEVIECEFIYTSHDNYLTITKTSKNHNGIIFKDGTWAEIIPTVTELSYQQIADKFGVDVNTLKIKK